MEHNLFRKDLIVFNTISYFMVTVFSFLCLIPFLITLSGSLTAEAALFEDGYRIIPKTFSFAAYNMIFSSIEVVARSYFVTIALVLLGTTSGLFLTSMTSYALNRKDLKYRNKFAFFFFFTTLFSGGLVPWYLIMISLGMKNNFFALLIPNLFSVFNIIILRTYFSSIPDSIGESAKIDGAGDFVVFIKLYLPISIPALVTIGLFIALGYWNDWYTAMLFISDPKLVPLQYHLYKIFNTMQLVQLIAQKTGMPVSEMPSESFKLAMTMVVTGPIIIVFPFCQKYFIRGLTLGAVKG